MVSLENLPYIFNLKSKVKHYRNPPPKQYKDFIIFFSKEDINIYTRWTLTVLLFCAVFKCLFTILFVHLPS